MSYGGSGERPATPDDDDVLHAWFETYANAMHTSFPARVQSYDPALQVADLIPVIRHPVPQPDGSHEYEELPVLPSVPVVFPRTTEWFLTLPIATGDYVVVDCCESAIGHWRVGDGSITNPGDLRRFDLSHATCRPGLFTRQAALARDQGAGDLGTDLVLGRIGTGTRVAIRADGQVYVEQGATTVFRIAADGTVNIGAELGASFVALAAYVDARIAALVTAHDTHTHTYTPGPGAAIPTGPALPLAGAQATVAATKGRAT